MNHPNHPAPIRCSGPLLVDCDSPEQRHALKQLFVTKPEVATVIDLRECASSLIVDPDSMQVALKALRRRLAGYDASCELTPVTPVH